MEGGEKTKEGGGKQQNCKKDKGKVVEAKNHQLFKTKKIVTNSGKWWKVI